MICKDLLLCMRTASILEVSVDKPGNVGPNQIVKNIRIQDYVNVIDAITLRARSILSPQLPQPSLGELIFSLVDAMMQTFPHQNLLLGHILLYSPLLLTSFQIQETSDSSFLSCWGKFWDRVQTVITTSSVTDAIWFVKAIKYANPGGLLNPGSMHLNTQYDIFDPLIDQRIQNNHRTIHDLVSESVNFDSISREYVENYPLTQKMFFRFFSTRNLQDPNLTTKEKLILTLFLHILADQPDSLIFRKNNADIATEIQQMAQTILSVGGNSTSKGSELLHQLSIRLNQSDGRLNPGTTADLTANIIFLALLFQKWPFS